uniref:Uncharacterized protein n=1 Tax=Schizaphis graminum TaxID=13262 RepID=A0A2S2NQI5_SCHGA
MPGNDMFVQTHSTPTTMDGDNNTYVYLPTYHNNIKRDAFSFSVSDFASISAPRPCLIVVVVVVGTSTKEYKRRGSTAASRDYFNDGHMFARQITSQINAIP